MIIRKNKFRKNSLFFVRVVKPLDPFQAIDPLTTENSKIEKSIPSTLNENIDFFRDTQKHEDDNEEERVDIDWEEINNIFDIIEDMVE